MPDAAFISRNRINRRQYWAGGAIRIVPDLIVEVIAPHERLGDVHRKRREWQAAGVRLIWLVDPSDKTVRIYTPNERIKFVTSTDTIDAEPIIPGFTCLVADFFAEPPLADN
jgi:Uma2 family endonuclease